MEKSKLIQLLKDAWNDGMSQYHDCKHHSQYKTDLENWLDSVEDEINELCVAENSSHDSAALPLHDVSVAKRKVCSLGINYEKCSEHPLNELGCSTCEKFIEQT